jgi:hypothetical protein
MKKYLVSIILILFLLLPTISSALELSYPTIAGYTLSLGIDINKLIAWFYYFIVSIAGLATFVMLVWGGFEWMTSTGNPARISSAKDRILSAFMGLIIILASWLILQVINPDLLLLRLPNL